MPGGGIPGLEGYSHEEIMGFYKKLANNEMPEELKGLASDLQGKGGDGYTDAQGNPIIDEEGGATIQPIAGFVVKTKDMKSKGKVFVNFTHHDLVEGFEEKPITKESA